MDSFYSLRARDDPSRSLAKFPDLRGMPVQIPKTLRPETPETNERPLPERDRAGRGGAETESLRGLGSSLDVLHRRLPPNPTLYPSRM